MASAGSDPALSTARGFGGGGIDSVVTTACTEAPDYAGLYDCQGKADSITDL